MRYIFRNRSLAALYESGKDNGQYGVEVFRAFERVMAVIGNAHDTRDLYALKSLHFEKLSGDRAGQHSLRLNKQWRLIIVLEADDQGRFVVVIEIIDYY